MKLSLTYPERSEEMAILMDGKLREKAEILKPLADPDEVIHMQEEVERVRADEGILSYILDLIMETRNNPNLAFGVSTRGGLYLLRASRAYAYIENRDFLIPDDVKTVAPYVLAHRIRTTTDSATPLDIVNEILEEVPVPL